MVVGTLATCEAVGGTVRICGVVLVPALSDGVSEGIDPVDEVLRDVVGTFVTANPNCCGEGDEEGILCTGRGDPRDSFVCLGCVASTRAVGEGS